MSTTGLDWEDVELNLLTLSFPKEFEAHFKETHFKKSLRHVRSALLLSILFFGIFGYLDAWIVPEAKYQLWFIRYALFCPFAMAVLSFSYSKFFKKYMQISVASVVGLAGLGIIAMIVFVPQSGNNSYYAGLILVFIFGYTFFKLDFIYATATGFMIVSAYEVAAIWSAPTSIPILINNNFFFLTVNLFGMFACYSIQLNSRKEFLQAKLLENEKKKVHFANLELENKVEQRTGQLLKANNVLKQEIGERNRAEEHLWESKENYRSILESMAEGYYEIDISGKLRFFNDAFYRIVGYSREELMGTNYRKFTDPQDAGRVFRAFNNVYVSHKPSREFEWKIIRRDGLTRHLEASVSIVKGPEDLPNGFRGVIRDVTDRILAEQSLKKAYQELKYTQSQLVQSGKLASIGELAAGVAHELNQPLMVIRGNAQLVKRFISKGNYGIEDLLKQMEPIERNTKRMMNIINHLRTFSRQSKSEYFALNINQVIEESFLMVGEQLRLRNIEIKKTLDPGLPKIMGDMNQLEQVFLNLITNARDAITEKEGGERQNNGNADSIEIITRTSEDNKNLIEILFKDSGKGINDSVQSSIFDPFFTTKEVGKGTGLGLSISYGIIRDHNGQIEIAETGLQGTTFQVKLPIEGPNLNTEPMAKERDRETADGLT
jgi:PAS domain S-box-containing protein